MPLEPGATLGPYEIAEPLGAGGMGEVYRAHDTRLDRSVAIKVLPAHMSGDAELRSRFEREARTISSLNHPHVCSLYDVGREGDIDFLVMEYIEGETLAARLDGGKDTSKLSSLSTESMLRIGAEIAEALDAAHRKGIVHRDLKPGNVMLTRSGVKLLDFGLAKIMQPPNDPTSTLTQMPTRAGGSDPITQQGTILGTFQYMAPEQLEGQESDARSDIFALGAILFEMTTGKKAFEGKSQASLIAAILERSPQPMSELAPLTPPALENLVKACLAKDPDDRVQTAHDVLLQLRWIIDGGSRVGIPAPVAAHRRASRLPWIVASALAVTVAVFAYLAFTRESPVRLRTITEIRTTETAPLLTMFGGHLALSPDGRHVAYAAFSEEGTTNLWVRSLDNPLPRAISGSEGAFYPFWSPDSKYIAFFSTGKLRKVPVAGGPAVTLCASAFARGGAWSSTGTIVFSPSPVSPLVSVRAAGGTPVALTRIDSTEQLASHRFPCFLPDGEHFVYVVVGEAGSELRVGSLDGSVDRRLFATDSNARYANGRLVYVRENTLIAAPFDTKTFEVTGEGEAIAEPIATSSNYARADFSVSQNGVLVYSEGVGNTGSNLVTYSREGIQLSSLENDFEIDDPMLSLDAGHVAFMRADAERGEVDVWTYDLSREVYSRLSYSGNADDPVWSPDGKYIIYADNGNLYRKRASGAGRAQLVYASAEDKVTHDWSRDGRWVVYSVVSADEFENICVIDLDANAPEAEVGGVVEEDDSRRDEAEAAASGFARPGSPVPAEKGIGRPIVLIQTPYRETQATFSPDSHWLAYASDASGRLEVYVQGFPGLEGKWQVSNAGGGMPRWRGDGKELFFVSPQREMMAVDIEATGDELTVGQVRKLFDTHMHRSSTIRTHQYMVRDDGRLFIVADRPAAADQGGSFARLILNWDAELGE